MHIFDSDIIPYFFLPEKNEGNLLNQAIHESLSTCLAFGSTSNNHYALINTPTFCQVLISYIGFHRLLLESYPTDNEMQGVLARQFRELNQWIKGIHIGSHQESNGINSLLMLVAVKRGLNYFYLLKLQMIKVLLQVLIR